MDEPGIYIVTMKGALHTFDWRSGRASERYVVGGEATKTLVIQERSEGRLGTKRNIAVFPLCNVESVHYVYED